MSPFSDTIFNGSPANPEINPEPTVRTGATKSFKNLTEPWDGKNSIASGIACLQTFNDQPHPCTIEE